MRSLSLLDRTPRRLALAAAAAVLALAAGACSDDGGGGAASSGGSSGGTAASAPPTSEAPAATAAELEAYLARMREVNDEWVRVSRRYNAAVGSINTSEPDASWDRAARRVEAIGPDVARVHDELDAITPPPGLERAHSGWTQSAELSEVQTSEVARLLRAHKLDTLVTFATTIGNRRQEQSQGLRRRWQLEVTEAGRQLDVPIPPWVEDVGAMF